MFLCDWVRRAAGFRRGAGEICLLLGLMAAATLGGCPTSSPACARNSDCEAGNYCSGGTCISDCTPATVADDCNPGESCNSFGMCVAPPDGGMRDAGGPRDAGTDAPPFDGGGACVVAGGTDADGDGFCAGALAADDCDDGNTAIHPGVAEICTSSAGGTTTGTIAADEDCDGELDEGCGWFFAQPHPLIRQHLSNNAHFSPHLSSDGLRLYYVHYDGTAAVSAVYVARRTTLDAEFGPPERVITTLGTIVVAGITLSENELEAFIQARAEGASQQHIHRMTRASVDAPFSAPVMVASVSALVNSYHPHLSRDGLELVFLTDVAGSRTARRVLRSDTSADFTEAPTDLTLPTGSSNWLFPTLSSDRHTIFYAVGSQLYRASRGDLASGTFTDGVDIADLNIPGAFSISVFVSENTGEIFFDGANRPYSPTRPGVDSLWRARLCRDGACEEQRVECDIAGGAARSTDGLHCYWRPSGDHTFGNAYSVCGDGHLATIHSTAENALLGGGYLGAYDGAPGLGLPPVPNCTLSVPGCSFAWVTGEPMTFSPWNPPTEPSGDGDAVERFGAAGTWNDIPGSFLRAANCERELWPTW